MPTRASKPSFGFDMRGQQLEVAFCGVEVMIAVDKQTGRIFLSQARPATFPPGADRLTWTKAAQQSFGENPAHSLEKVSKSDRNTSCCAKVSAAEFWRRSVRSLRFAVVSVPDGALRVRRCVSAFAKSRSRAVWIGRTGVEGDEQATSRSMADRRWQVSQ